MTEDRWQALVDKQLVGESLSDADRELIHSDPALGIEMQILDGLADPEQFRDDLRERAVAKTAIERLERGEEVSAGDARKGPGVVVWIAAGGLSVAAAVALLVRAPEPEPVSSAHRAPAPAQPRVPFVVAEGAMLIDGNPADGAETAPMGSTVELVRGTACLELARSVFACLGEGSKLRLTELDEPKRRVDLVEGRVVVALDKQTGGASFSVVAADIWSTAMGTMFSVEVNDDGVVQTAVYEGVVRVGAEVTGAPVETHKIGLAKGPNDVEIEAVSGADNSPEWEAVERVSGRHAEAPPEPEAKLEDEPEETLEEVRSPAAVAPPPAKEPASAGDLLGEARRARIARDWAGAARAYRALLQSHPGSGEARTVLVSLGELELGRLGQPGQALTHFEQYLSAGGALTIEAKLGRIRALRALGRVSDEARAIDEFLAAHPGNLESEALRQRRAELASD